MISKAKLLEMVKKFPDQFTLDEVFDRIVLLDKIETGLQESKNGDVIRDEDLDNYLSEWLNKI